MIFVNLSFFSFSGVEVSEIMDTRELITLADELAREQGLTQAEWSRKAGFDEFGKLISNTYKRMNCKLSVLTALLRPLGYELTIVKREDEK